MAAAYELSGTGAAGTGIAGNELELLQAHLDTAMYDLLEQYPDGDARLLLNCLLLSATAGIASGDRVSANYHFTWFQVLSAPPC
ncbi:MAG: DUF5631 domain-containing protein [Mycobacterium sp.]|nr:DUF5631 domain-containing protein [Mycobacterium sp.]MBV9352435.1 DUF5631 domain-containing protein [Mycobacterium sp.]